MKSQKPPDFVRSVVKGNYLNVLVGMPYLELRNSVPIAALKPTIPVLLHPTLQHQEAGFLTLKIHLSPSLTARTIPMNTSRNWLPALNFCTTA